MNMNRFGRFHQPGSQLVGQWLLAGSVRWVQHGEIAIPAASSSATGTIFQVNPNNSLLFHQGQESSQSDNSAFVRVELTNATTVTAYHNAASVAAPTVRFSVLEFYPGFLRSVQRGTIATSGADVSVAVTPVNFFKAMLTHLGTTESAAGFTASALVSVSWSASVVNEITAYVSQTSGNQVTGWQLAEFW